MNLQSRLARKLGNFTQKVVYPTCLTRPDLCVKICREILGPSLHQNIDVFISLLCKIEVRLPIPKAGNSTNIERGA